MSPHRERRYQRTKRTARVAVLLIGLLGMQTASADYTWANTNVFGATPTSPRDWFPGGPNTQGTWIGGAPVSFQGYAAQTVFFQDNTTPLGNTGASGNVQTVNLNSNGVPFQLRLLVLSGKSSDTPGANLDMTLTGDPLWFSNLTSPVGGTIQVRGVNNVQTLLSYDVKNPIIIGNTGSGGKGTLVVLGAGSAGLNLSGDISELQAGGGRISKQGFGTTATLSGSNAISGGLEVQGGTIVLSGSNTSGTNSVSIRIGTMVFDLAGGNDRWSGGTAIPKPNLNAGTLTVLGAPSGTSSQTLAEPESSWAQSTIIIDPNGGDGTTLTLGNTNKWPGQSYHGILVIDRSAPGAVVRSNLTLANGLVAFNGESSKAGILIKDSSGIGFATTNGIGEVVRYTSASTLLPNSNSWSTNFKTTGNLTLTATTKHDFCTLELDASAGDGILDLGATNVASLLLMTGGHDYTIQNGNYASYLIHHFGTGTLTINATLTRPFRKSGPGRVILNGANTLGSTDGVGFTICDGVVQAIDGVGLPANRTLRLFGGVFQSNGSLVPRWVHSDSPYDQPKVSWIGFNSNFAGRGGGFAAQGGTFTINLYTNAALTANAVLRWGAFVQNDQTLILGSTSADSLLDWQNNIDLGASLPNAYPGGSWLMREIQVNDNPASTTDIAQMSGALTGNAGGLLKTGDGTLLLAAANTYGGPTDVNGGTLLVNGSLDSKTAPVTVDAGGTLGGSGTINRSVDVYADATLNGSLGLTCGTNVTLKSGAKIAWDYKATGKVTVNGTLTLPTTASVTFGSIPAGQLVLFESPNAIVGSVAGWTVTPALINLRVSADGKQVFASSGGTLLMIR